MPDPHGGKLTVELSMLMRRLRSAHRVCVCLQHSRGVYHHQHRHHRHHGLSARIHISFMKHLRTRAHAHTHTHTHRYSLYAI